GFATTGYDYFNEPWHLELIGDPWAGEMPAGQQTPKEEAEVKHYRSQDKTARNGGRIVPPGGHFYLHTQEGVPTSQASNIVGGVGTYSITAHVYAEGVPGDVVDVVLLWDDTKTKGPHSQHYTERLTIGPSGFIFSNFEF